MKTNVQKFEDEIKLDNVSPLEMSIEEILKYRAEERKRKMKEFNHKFNNNAQIDEFERIPAYKRMGVDVTSTPNNTNNQSRMSLGVDSNDDIQLRSNNSFLHDNVD
jgi:cell division protein FtsZ